MSEKTCGHKYEAKFGCPECAAKVRAEYPEFPLQTSRNAPPGPASVPWAVAEKAWAAYSARYGRDQSVERLAQRGGFGWCEMDDLFPGWREATDEWAKLRRELASEREAREKAMAALEAVRDANAAEAAMLRERAEQAEWERDEARRLAALNVSNAEASAATSHRMAQEWRTTAETHLRERDDALLSLAAKNTLLARAEDERDVASTARDSAEADNAELVEGLRAFRSLPGLDGSGSSAPFVRAYTEAERRADELLAAGHPGAALLEELRALRKVREALQPFHEMAGALACMRIEAPDDAPVRRTPITRDHTHVLTMRHCRALVDALAADALGE